MDTNTRYLLKRMDDMSAGLQKHMDQKFESLSHKIDDLQAFKNRVIGMACMAGALGSLVVNLIMNFLKQG